MRLVPRHHAPLPPSRRPVELAPAITAAIHAVDERLRAAWASVDATRREAPAPDGGWSIGQVLEHIALTNEAYLARMAPMVERLTAAAPVDVPWRPTWLGRWLARSLEMQIPLPAPRRIVPGPSPRTAALEAVLASHTTVCRLLAQVAARDWSAARMVSPLNALVRPNCGDAFVVVLRHSERHAAQLERVATAHRGDVS